MNGKVGNMSVQEMKKDTVGLTKVTDDNLSTHVARSFDLINFKIDRKVESIIIKPNLCYYWDSFTGYTTDPRLVASIIDVLREKYGLDKVNIKIAEADASAMRTSHAFKMLGYERLAEEKHVTLTNLSAERTTTKKVSIMGKEISYEVPESLLSADLFVNVPKMKIMSATILTCALKNIFGCIATPRKLAYHPILEEAIVGINTILKPHLTIVDGMIALSHFPVKMNLLVSGLSPFSVDWTVAKIMGYNPNRIRFLRLARQERLGDPDEMQIIGEKLTDFKNKFPHVNAFRLKWQNKLQLKLLRTYSKIVDDVIPPFLET
jgi:uncharacterized protein (DUF362 family)